VISVSATDIGDELAPYSNTGAAIDIAAPGGDSATDRNFDGLPDGVLSTLGADTDSNPSTPPAPTVATLDGTSMATPHVAGVAALMRALRPALSGEEFDTLLAAGRLTRDLGPPGRDDDFGHGLLDARRALLAALELENGGTLPGILAASPTTLDFGAFLQARELELFNAGGSPVTVTAISPDRPWLAVTPLETDANGIGRYEVAVDRAQLPEQGAFAGRIEIDADTVATSVAVRVIQAPPDSLADAGLTFLIFVDPDAPPDATFQATALTARDGVYRFRRTDLPAGDYEIYAGSDFDNDNVICEPGESCGIFPTLDDPATVTLETTDLDDLDFVISYRTNFEVSAAAGAATSAARRTGGGFRISKPGS
jgi:serine protease